MKCNQSKCGFQQYPELCPQCDECKAEPLEVNEECVNCWNCLKDEGFIRSGKPKGELQNEQHIKNRTEIVLQHY